MAYRTRRSYRGTRSRTGYSRKRSGGSRRKSYGGTQRIVIQVAQPAAPTQVAPAGYKTVPLRKATL